jgi:hypothetical protein
MSVPYFCNKSQIVVRKFFFWNVIKKDKKYKTTFALVTLSGTLEILYSLHGSQFLEITENIGSQLMIQTGTGGALEMKQNIGYLLMIQTIPHTAPRHARGECAALAPRVRRQPRSYRRRLCHTCEYQSRRQNAFG